MLVCAAGMSTSLLVTKMEKAAAAMGDEVEIFALPISEGEKRVGDVDCILLGPQVRFQKNTIEKAMEAAGVSKPCDVIDMKDYGMMNGEAVYKKAKAMMGDLIIIPGLSRKVRLSLFPVRLPPLRWDNMRMIRSEP